MNHPIGIPSIDLADFLSGDAARKQHFVQSLGKAYEDVGFVAVKNHILSDAVSARLYGQIRSFFTLPEQTKQNYEIEGLAGQRGYTSFGKEHAKGRSEGDLKEFWHFGQYVEDGDPIRQTYPENIAVSELPDFNEAGKEVFKALEQTGQYLLPGHCFIPGSG